MEKQAKILYGATELGAPQFSSDILWRTKFRVPDPVFLVGVEEKTFLFVSSLEFGRADKEARVDEVILSDGGIGQVIRFLKAERVRRVIVPHNFPYGLAKSIGQEFVVGVKQAPFYPERMRKTKWEIGEIGAAQEAAERALKKAMTFLQSTRIRGAQVYEGRATVTSERVRKLIDDSMYADGYFGINTIVSCGVQAADPHAAGAGPLQARAPIVIDIFPVSLSTHYYGDMTRTIFRGEPSKEYVRMYEAVRAAQEQAIAQVRAGADGKDIYDGVCRYFNAEGYPTRIGKNRSEGFIHGLGHGVGLEIHEPPSLGARSWTLEAGNVVTVEPGLYYRRRRDRIPAGGIRIEDVVVVEKKGCRNLTAAPKELSSVILK